MEEVESMDPETEFLYSKKETGNEWELFKENARPLKRGRNVALLNEALKSHTDNHLKKSLFEHRRRLIEAIDAYQGDDPLQPWLECIKWVQEAFPPGGDSSGLVVLYEQCVRSFWHSERYKDDLRYLKVWLEYADNCSDAEVIFSFLDANHIGESHSLYYIAYAKHMESRNKVKIANDIFNLGLARNARPKEKLEEAYKKFLARSMRRQKMMDEDLTENQLPARSFGTVLARGETNRQITENTDAVRKKCKPNRPDAVPLAILKDINSNISSSHRLDSPKADLNSWHALGARAERNKENNAMPTKWTSHKILQRPGSVTARAAPASCIPVFVDEECEEIHKAGVENGKASAVQLKRADGQDLKKETELLRENPLRNFPPNSLPR
ncbi:Mad3/Bub1 homology region 1 [Dillenia turbinata]|uniref:Mad3/Bub1 homology region 1 n=1 Tax=Dillenia turbinata TaxID=194707 RepID=A0AAN8ZWS9_9MAGN